MREWHGQVQRHHARIVTAVRFEYAKNGEAVTFSLGEKWCWDGLPPVWPDECVNVANYAVTWAKEFRYDGARARYLNRPVEPGPLENTTPSVQDLSPGGQYVETIYDGDQPYADRVAGTFDAPNNV